MAYLVEDNPAERRFEILVDDKVAGTAHYRVAPGLVIFVHTEVDPAYQGQGIGGKLARGALDQVRERGERVQAPCPFIAKFIADHPEYGDLLESGSAT